MILTSSIVIFAVSLTLVIVLLCAFIYFYFHKRFPPTEEESYNVAKLAKEKEMYGAEIEQCQKWLNEHKEELFKLEAEREEQERVRQELADLQMKLATEEQKIEPIRKEYNNLQNTVLSLAQQRENIENEIKQLEDDRSIAEEKARSVEEDGKKAFQKTQDIVNELNQKQNEVKELNSKLTDQTLALESIKQTIQAKEQLINDLEETIKLSNKMAEDAVSNAERAKRETTELISRRDQINKDIEEKKRYLDEIIAKTAEKSVECKTIDNQISQKQNTLDKINEQILDESKEHKQIIVELQNVKQKFTNQKAELEKIESAVRTERAKHETLRDKNLDNEEKARKLESRIAFLEDKQNQLSGQGDKGEEDPYETLYDKPEFFSEFSSKCDDYSELTAIDNLKSYLKDCNLSFPDRVLYSFHTSLKIADISPLLVMAGISGTGKTELPRRYAEAMGMNFLLLPVQPRWDSPQDMFGFYNYLEQRYKPTELAQALVYMDKWNHKKCAEYWDRMLLVLLDEMNLARPEYYFSEFLSRLEVRRSINPDIDEDRRKAEVSLDIGKYGNNIKIPRLYVHKNVLFVGTMNEDESTQTLSDKVIDRANVIRFSRPEKMTADQPNPSDQNGKYLSLSVWDNWKHDHEDIESQIRKEVEIWLEQLNDGLDEIGRPFGYRIYQSIFSYLANYPSINSYNTHKFAFADQVEQKILPKLRGLDLQANEACFNAVGDVIEKLDDEELLNAYEKATHRDKHLFSWHGVTRKSSK